MLGNLKRGTARARGKARAALVAVVMLVGALMMGAGPAAADYVVCASLSYQFTGEEKEVLLEDECHMWSGWNPQHFVGPDCDVYIHVRVCYDATVSHPMP